ncbi:MAG: DUF1854 domain-containing protein [Clostridia bacterium]|nr:DUF1854 domain-containing protein [Clostridia bacterium]
MMKNRDEYSVSYLTAQSGEFYETKGGLLGYRTSDADYPRVSLYRMFPLHDLRRFISVREEKHSREDRRGEIGVIEDIDTFPAEQLELIERELERRYFVPEVLAVKNVKEEFGHTYWETSTSAGDRSFTVFDMNNSVINLGEGRVLVIDIDGNRFVFPDISKVGEKALKYIDIWL